MSKIQRELQNYFAVVADLASGAEVWDARPAWLEFAPNNLCNLRCIMCAQADGVPLEVMPKEAAIALLDEVLPQASLWTPSALSEPMLANIKLVLQKCREHEVWLNMYSNCTVLNGARMREIGDRIHKLWISFDSPDREVLEMLRAGADFDRVVQNIREVLAVATERGIPVGFVAVLVKDNVERLAALVDFIADLGAVDARCDLRIQPMLDNAVRCRDQNVFAAYSQAEILGHLDAAVARAEARGMIFHVDMDDPYRRSVAPQPAMVRGIVPDVLLALIDDVRRRFPHFCYMGATYMKIEPSGDVFPCCRGPRELLMGNTHERSVDEIWNSDAYRDFRRRMNAKDYPEVCRTCDHLVANPHFDKAWLSPPAPADDSPDQPPR
jgi:radical SAM protein with 4Fe4S-binding SPASM domain